MVSRTILFICCLSICISIVYGIKCFQCNSATDEGCAQLTNQHTNSSYYKECEEEIKGKPPFCRRTHYTIVQEKKIVRVSRECGYLVYKSNETRCYELDTDYKFELNCQCFTDGCNSAPASLSSMLTIVSVSFSALVGIRLLY